MAEEQQQEDVRTIDQALAMCKEQVEQHRRSARLILLVLVQLGMLTIMGLAVLLGSRSILGSRIESNLDTTLVSGALLFLSVMLGILVSLYRFHLVELARTEHYLLGFMRIRIAANNPKGGFGGDVRRALTEGAFAFEPQGRNRFQRVPSPLPGHPTSDLSSLLASKILEQIEVSIKQKNDGDKDR